MAGSACSAPMGGDPTSAVAVRPADSKVAFSIGTRLQQLTADYGFRYYLFARFPHGDRVDFLSNHLLSNWPDDLRQHYAATDVFRASHLVSSLKQTILPVFSDCCVFSKGEANQNGNGLSAAFASHGLRDTLAFSLHDYQLGHYIFAFSGTLDGIAEPQRNELLLRSMRLLDTYAAHHPDIGRPKERLSGREIECLRWSAAGKSSEEIAIILNISAHTVASYLKGAMRKLDAVNRMQAVARACRYRLI